MSLSKFSPMTIVLSLLATLSLIVPTVNQPRRLRLQTGYPYNDGENPTTAEQYRDLKCAYLMASVTHMRLLKFILEEKTISFAAADLMIPNSVAVRVMGYYNIWAVICTLYGVDDVEIGSLWLLLLYSSTLSSTYELRIANEVDGAKVAEAVNGLMALHDYVTAGMQRELSAANCRPGNRFGWYNKRFQRRIAVMPSGQQKLKHIEKAVNNNCADLDRLLEGNEAQSTYGRRRYEALKSKQRFVNNLGGRQNLKSMLMNTYDVQVSWGRASEVLENYYENVRHMYSPTDCRLPLLSIKTYYSGIFGLLKVIMCRLTWKCLLYVETSQRHEDHLTKCRDLLKEFQHLLHLYDDEDVVDLVDRLSGSLVVVADVINLIRLQLQRINVVLQCVATNDFVLETEQSSSSAQQDTSSHADDIVATTQAFIEFITNSFKMIDFDVIRSIVKYVDSKYLLTSDTI